MPKVGAEGRVEGERGSGLECSVWHWFFGSADVESARVNKREFGGRGAWGNGARHVDVEVPVSAVDAEIGVGAEGREFLCRVGGPDPGLRR